MRIFSLYNIKGGVGKTTSAVSLAHLAAADGYRTLLWDLDPQAAATYMLRVRPKIAGGAKELIRGNVELEGLIRESDFPGLELLPADFSYRKLDGLLGKTPAPSRALAELLVPLAYQYDLLFLDCPPSISRLSSAVFGATDYLLVPTIPTPLSLRTLERLRVYLAGRRRPPGRVLPFFSLVDRRKGLHRRTCDPGNELRAGFLEAAIPYSSLVEQMSVRRLPLEAFARSSPAAVAYRELWQELRRWLREPSAGL